MAMQHEIALAGRSTAGLPIAAPLQGEILGPDDAITVVLRPHPFRAHRDVFEVPAGLSLAEIAERCAERIDGGKARHFEVALGAELVAPELWRRVRPKAGATVGFHAKPRGGGGQLLRTLAMLFVVILTAFVAPYLAAAGISTFGVALISAAPSRRDGVRLTSLFPRART